MKIDLDKKQFKELLLLVSIGAYIKGALEDMKGKYYDEYKIMGHLLGYAKDFGLEDMTEMFEGKLIQSDKSSEKIEEMMDEYEEDEFWHRLVMYLGKRDFFREVSEDELKEIKKDEFSWLPDRIRDFYARYEKEFEKYGVERLAIDENSEGKS